MTTKLIDEARVKPGTNRSNICDWRRDLLGSTNSLSSILSAASVSVGQDMIKVPSRQIPGPTIRYSNQVTPTIDNLKGRWTLQGIKGVNKFVESDNSAIAEKVYLLVPNKSHSEKHMEVQTSSTIEWARELLEAIELYGSKTLRGEIKRQVQKNFSFPTERFEMKGSHEKVFRDVIAKAKAGGKEKTLVLLFLPEKGGHQGIFADFKRISDCEHGVHLIGMAAESAHAQQEKGRLGQYMANVSLKLNVKLGHTNHELELPSDIGKTLVDTLILGADVTHPSPGGFEPSITAVVGSVARHYGKFFGSVRHQEGGKEIIDDMQDMVKDRLKAWYNASKDRILPSKILFYRDGVDDSQYGDVLEREVLNIEAAFSAVKTEIEKSEYRKRVPTQNNKPLITAVIVTKRHHTRFYPVNAAKSDNCRHGTCVESGVTHPCYLDFFLQSGTAKPTYYFVLRNDMNFSPKAIQDLTNHLCYTYVRCTSPVGYVPAAYYADQLCERVRLYIKRADLGPGFRPTDAPPRPGKEKGESKDERDAKLIDWKKGTDTWKRSVTEKWRQLHKGPSVNGMANSNSNGPWHANLNETMFWM